MSLQWLLAVCLAVNYLSVISKQSWDRLQGRGIGIVHRRTRQREGWRSSLTVKGDLETGQRRAGRAGRERSFPAAVCPAQAVWGLRDTREVAAPLPASRDPGGCHRALKVFSASSVQTLHQNLTEFVKEKNTYTFPHSQGPQVKIQIEMQDAQLNLNLR